MPEPPGIATRFTRLRQLIKTVGSALSSGIEGSATASLKAKPPLVPHGGGLAPGISHWDFPRCPAWSVRCCRRRGSRQPVATCTSYKQGDPQIPDREFRRRSSTRNSLRHRPHRLHAALIELSRGTDGIGERIRHLVRSRSRSPTTCRGKSDTGPTVFSSTPWPGAGAATSVGSLAPGYPDRTQRRGHNEPARKPEPSAGRGPTARSTEEILLRTGSHHRGFTAETARPCCHRCPTRPGHRRGR